MSDTDSYESSAVVIDNGSYMIRAGFAGDDEPRAVFRSIVSKPRHQRSMSGPLNKDVYVGDEAMVNKINSYYNVSEPIQNNQVSSWDDMVCYDK